ncbi:rhodanese-like domain-containing protein [uncultured Tateyamaria sp.]|uniref:rhodanese-like domain-containing protein n=1 Tax=uncultured Tateyamaria sp. TaxID=455651 RepID=UPI0026069E18|nr:rhodanese-like domain-containing protein [uncultured Tateyamaria sp.]
MDHSYYSISAFELLTLLGTDKAPCLIDVCLTEDIKAEPWCLPGAQHVQHRDVQLWGAAHARDRPVITICQKGLKLSHGAAAQLRSMGFDARALTGGNRAWCTANYPRIALSDSPAPGTSWVLHATRDAHACIAAWVILRWYDPRAILMWVASEHVQDVAARFEAYALPETPLAQSFAATGLRYPDLLDFVTSVDTLTNPVTSLLGVLSNLHERDEDLIHAALPFLDAAWLVHRQSDRQEVA